MSSSRLMKTFTWTAADGPTGDIGLFGHNLRKPFIFDAKFASGGDPLLYLNFGITCECLKFTSRSCERCSFMCSDALQVVIDHHGWYMLTRLSPAFMFKAMSRRDPGREPVKTHGRTLSASLSEDSVLTLKVGQLTVFRCKTDPAVCCYSKLQFCLFFKTADRPSPHAWVDITFKPQLRALADRVLYLPEILDLYFLGGERHLPFILQRYLEQGGRCRLSDMKDWYNIDEKPEVRPSTQYGSPNSLQHLARQHISARAYDEIMRLYKIYQVTPLCYRKVCFFQPVVNHAYI